MRDLRLVVGVAVLLVRVRGLRVAAVVVVTPRRRRPLVWRRVAPVVVLRVLAVVAGLVLVGVVGLRLVVGPGGMVRAGGRGNPRLLLSVVSLCREETVRPDSLHDRSLLSFSTTSQVLS